MLSNYQQTRRTRSVLVHLIRTRLGLLHGVALVHARLLIGLVDGVRMGQLGHVQHRVQVRADALGDEEE